MIMDFKLDKLHYVINHKLCKSWYKNGIILTLVWNAVRNG